MDTWITIRTTAEDAPGIEAADHTTATAVDPFVSVNIGYKISVIVRDLAVIDALEAALADARTMLTAASTTPRNPIQRSVRRAATRREEKAAARVGAA